MQKLHIMYKEMSIYIFLNPLIKKSNSSICIVYLSYLYLQQNISYLLWETIDFEVKRSKVKVMAHGYLKMVSGR